MKFYRWAMNKDNDKDIVAMVVNICMGIADIHIVFVRLGVVDMYIAFLGVANMYIVPVLYCPVEVHPSEGLKESEKHN